MDGTEAEEGDGAVAASELERLRRALDEERQQNLRLLADFDNYRRRVARDREAARLDGRCEVLLAILPVLDTLERALAAGSTDQTFYDGVAATYRLFMAALREAGAEPIEALGRRFNPALHEAIGTEWSDAVEPGVIARELRRGWRLGDELLRPAQVVVAARAKDVGAWR